MTIPLVKRRARAHAVARRIVVAVIGSGQTADPHSADVGRLIATLGYDLLTGGGRGVMEAVSRAFFETSPRRGIVIGIVPAEVHGLRALEERNADLGVGIRQKMFTFEDLSILDPPSLQKILREIDMRDLAVSLKSASEKLKTALLSCISKRAAETVNEEMGFMGPLKLKDIEAAQQRIIEVVRRLEGEGEIELDSGKGNETGA